MKEVIICKDCQMTPTEVLELRREVFRLRQLVEKIYALLTIQEKE